MSKMSNENHSHGPKPDFPPLAPRKISPCKPVSARSSRVFRWHMGQVHRMVFLA